MSVKPDHWIVEMARSQGMIEPFVERNVGKGQVSYGVSSYGYDFRLYREFRKPAPGRGAVLDPKQVMDAWFEEVSGDSLVLEPNSFALARSLEYFRIPRKVLALCVGKSTYARCGVIVNVTPLEPEWEGFLTVCLCNSGPAPVRIYAEEGIAQLIFFEADEACTTSYRDRKGKYQAQQGIAHSRVEGAGDK